MEKLITANKSLMRETGIDLVKSMEKIYKANTLKKNQVRKKSRFEKAIAYYLRVSVSAAFTSSIVLKIFNSFFLAFSFR